MRTGSACVLLLAALLALAGPGCTDETGEDVACEPATDAAACAKRAVSSEDLAILSVVIATVEAEGPCIQHSGESRVVLIDRTIDAQDANMDAILFQLGTVQAASFRCETLEDLVCRNRSEHELSGLLPSDDLVSSEDLGEVGAYVAGHPEVMSVVRVSLPGMDASGTEALVYFERRCAGLDAEGGLARLERVDAGWRLVRYFPLWIS